MPMLGCKGLKQSPSGLSPSYHLHNFFAENVFVQVIAMCSFLLKFNLITIIFSTNHSHYLQRPRGCLARKHYYLMLNPPVDLPLLHILAKEKR